jgi:hypothetical protein
MNSRSTSDFTILLPSNSASKGVTLSTSSDDTLLEAFGDKKSSIGSTGFNNVFGCFALSPHDPDFSTDRTELSNLFPSFSPRSTKKFKSSRIRVASSIPPVKISDESSAAFFSFPTLA